MLRLQPYFRFALNYHLFINNNSEEAKDKVKQILEYMTQISFPNSGERDLFNELMCDIQNNVLSAAETIKELERLTDIEEIEQKIDTDDLDARIKCIYEKMYKTTKDESFRKLLAEFEESNSNSTKFNLIIKTGPQNISGAAQTLPPNTKDGKDITIIFPPGANDYSDLEIELSLFHEVIHAYHIQLLIKTGILYFDEDVDESEPSYNKWKFSGNNSNNNPSFCDDAFEADDSLILLSFSQYYCLYIANNVSNHPAAYGLHHMFSSTFYDLDTYRQNMTNFLLNFHDWLNEPSIPVRPAQNINSKEDFCDAISWKGVKGNKFKNWLQANNWWDGSSSTYFSSVSGHIVGMSWDLNSMVKSPCN